MAGIVAVDDHVRRRVPREGALRQLRLRILGRSAGEGYATTKRKGGTSWPKL